MSNPGKACSATFGGIVIVAMSSLSQKYLSHSFDAGRCTYAVSGVAAGTSSSPFPTRRPAEAAKVDGRTGLLCCRRCRELYREASEPASLRPRRLFSTWCRVCRERGRGRAQLSPRPLLIPSERALHGASKFRLTSTLATRYKRRTRRAPRRRRRQVTRGLLARS